MLPSLDFLASLGKRSYLNNKMLFMPKTRDDLNKLRKTAILDHLGVSGDFQKHEKL